MKNRVAWYLALPTIVLLSSAILLLAVSRIFGIATCRNLAQWLFYAGVMLPLAVLAVALCLSLWDDRRGKKNSDAWTIRQLKAMLRRDAVDPVMIQDILEGASGLFGNACLQNFHQMVERGDFEADEELAALIQGNIRKRRDKIKRTPPRQAVRLIKTTAKRKSKLGGIPELPPSIGWPKNPSGARLDFLAQIYCPDLPDGLGLPSSGTLFVFYDCGGLGATGKHYWRVIYSEEPLPESKYKAEPCADDAGFREFFLDFEVFQSRKDDGESDDGESHHQMLGYSKCVQRGEMVSGKVLLLQLDSDDTEDGPGWMWGDAGCLFFWITPKDLANCKFDRIQLEAESF